MHGFTKILYGRLAVVVLDIFACAFKVTRYTFNEQVKKSHNFYAIYRILTKTSIQEENIQLIKNQ